MIEKPEDRFDFLLTYTARGLELRKTAGNAPGPVYVDFVGGALGYRRHHGGGRRQPLARALGLRATTNPYVIDATAGLGGDAFVLAGLGCRVLMLERSAAIHALVADGLRRARSYPDLQTIVSRLTLRHADASAYLDALPIEERPDVIYLDPMYPHRGRSALNKKEMRNLRELVGNDEDAPALLAKSLTRAKRRVAVKRPRSAPPVEGPAPTMQLVGRTTRYDVYRLATVG